MKRSTLQLVTRHSSLVTVLAFAVLAANADVKYWDNPDFRAFDVGDYVQDGLQVNYDGIRNAGPNAPHDFSAMTWANCADSGSTYDMTRYSLVSGAWTNNNATGSWTDTGFVFNKDAIFHEMTSITIQKTYTIQTLVNATGGDQNGVGYIMCDYNDNKDGLPKQHPGNWAGCCLGIRSSTFNYGASYGGSPANTFYLVSSQRPYFAASSATEPFSYATAIHNHSEGVMFAGTKAPWGATDGSYRSDLSDAIYVRDWGISLGGHYPRTDEHLKGTLKNFRLYSKCLSDEEVAWNRVVDEARYFHRRAAIPVTNVVVATTIPGIEDDHFALDAEGYTFTAPAQRTVKGYRYVLNGYTLETWNGSGWNPATTHTGNSYVATSSDKVRLTWQYEHPAGEGRIVFYDETDYETDGLLVHYDGILNAGAGAAHDYAASTWVNLGSGGATYDLTLAQKVAGNQGYWLGNGYRFEGNSVFSSAKHDGNWLTYTFQWVIDGKKSEQKYNPPYLFSASWSNFAFAMGDNPKTGCFHYNTQGASKRPYIWNSAKEYTYGTAISDAANREIKFFEGTSAPTSGGVADGYYKFADNTTMSALSYSQSSYNIGGYGSANGQYVGAIKDVRIYTKVLSDAEIAHNRLVDNYRYFGIYEPETTNVIVQSTYSYLNGYDDCGPYEVDGSYTFTAPATVTAPNGIEYACDGYIVEKKSGQVGWVVVAEGTSNAYAYSTAAGPVRLTWKWKATHGLRTAADYGFADYSLAGLRLHYDGLLNSGVDAARSTTATTKWVNLGSDGSAMNLTLSRHSSDNNRSAWGEKGYDFAGYAMFYSPAILWTTNSFTAQAFVDAALEDNTHASGNYIAATDWTRMGLQAYGYGDSARLNALGQNYMDPRPRFTPENGRLQYVTAIQNDSAKTTTIFPGTTAPTSGTATTGFRQYTTCSNEYTVAFRLGGWGGGAGSGQCLVGTLNNFRYYDRVLTEEELVRNRNVDSVRYFGELGVTNLVVAIEEGVDFDATPAPGAYFVEGSYDLSVAPGTDTPTRYKLHDWDATSGEWVNPRTVNGTTLNFNVANATAAKMKVTWCKTKAFMLIVR